LGAIGDAVISIDAEGRVDYLNSKAEQLTGAKASEAVGKPLGDVFLAVNELTQQSQEHELVTWLRDGHGATVNSPAMLISKDGTQYAIEDTAAPIRLPNGHVIGGVIVFRDVTESRQLLNTVTYQATHDALTGLVNRGEFEHRLERALARVKKSHAAGAVLFFDLDQFKVVNDTSGHDAGDKLLQQLAHLYRDEIRDRDTLARLGGDEFALIADHCSPQEAYTIARKILDSTRDYQFTYGERVFKVGVSIGLVTFNESTGSLQELMQLADRACYIAKENGRNQIHCFDRNQDALDSAQDRQGTDWIVRLTEAMRLDQLQLHYQPIASASNDHRGMHFEVLLRLVDPTHGVIMPGRFLPAAERYELMPLVDRWVIQRVMQWLDANDGNASTLKLCAINLSGKTLSDSSFVSDLKEMLGKYQAAPDSLCFEIQEAAAAIDLRKNQAVIEEIRALGCKVCLSGFGLGTGSFAILKQLHVDFLKIDSTFISAVSESPVDERMVELMHEIAHLTGKETIAERVEDQATAEVLSRIGIDYLQGHWIGYPMELNNGTRAPH
jgi:diguanylate cyclase